MKAPMNCGRGGGPGGGMVWYAAMIASCMLCLLVNYFAYDISCQCGGPGTKATKMPTYLRG